MAATYWRHTQRLWMEKRQKQWERVPEAQRHRDEETSVKDRH